MNDTHDPPGSQPKNGYGRIPDELLPKLRDLSHLEGHVFAMLCILANRKREPVGMVECLSLAHLARTVGVPRRSLYRAIAGLTKCDLVSQDAPGCCVMVSHYVRHGDTPVRHDVTEGETLCLTNSPQNQESLRDIPPRNVGTYRNVVDGAVAADPSHEVTPRKRRRAPPQWLVWDPGEEALLARQTPEAQARKTAFIEKWTNLLGNEDLFWAEKEKADEWLLRNEVKRAKVKRFDLFLNRWLEKLLKEG